MSIHLGDWFCPICLDKKKKKDKDKDKDKDRDKSNNKDQEKDTPKAEKPLQPATKNQKLDVPLPPSDEKSPEKKSPDKKKKTCPLLKKYSPNTSLTCPFPGCDGAGNVRPNSSVHYSVNQCPMSRDERKRERELLVRFHRV